MSQGRSSVTLLPTNNTNNSSAVDLACYKACGGSMKQNQKHRTFNQQQLSQMLKNFGQNDNGINATEKLKKKQDYYSFLPNNATTD